MRSFTVSENEVGIRLLRFCEKVCPTMPKSLLHKAFRNKRIKINGKKQSEDYRLQCGDKIELYINDEFFTEKKVLAIANHNKLNIVYEDDNVIIIFKPYGMLCHSDNKNQTNIVDMMLSYLYEKGEYLPEKENAFTPALCNRIDQGTEGLIIAAKNHLALADMNQIIHDRLLDKTYICITQQPVKSGEYRAFLTRDKDAKKVTVTDWPEKDSKEIITNFKVLKQKGGFYLIECILLTGRTHQIRAHIAHLGRPIVGDKKYGKAFPGVLSQLLCAYKISFKEIPRQSSVSYLSGQEFFCPENAVEKFFDNISNNH